MQKFKELKKSILKDEQVARYYKDLEPKYVVISQVIKARLQKGFSQEALAKKIGTKQSAISRLESGNYNPSLAFLTKVSKALGVKLRMSVE